MRQQPDEGKSECYPKEDLIEFHLFYQPSEKGRKSKSCVQVEHGCAIFHVINIRSSCQPGRIRLRLIGTPFRIKVIDQRGFFARFANKTCAGPVSSPGSRSQLSKEPSHGGKDTGAPEGNRNAWKHGAQSIGARLWQQGRSVEISQKPEEPVADGVSAYLPSGKIRQRPQKAEKTKTKCHLFVRRDFLETGAIPHIMWYEMWDEVSP
jgi:hypothetical protein